MSRIAIVSVGLGLAVFVSLAIVASTLSERKILIKSLNDPAPGLDCIRVTTALPEDNREFLNAIGEVLLLA